MKKNRLSIVGITCLLTISFIFVGASSPCGATQVRPRGEKWREGHPAGGGGPMGGICFIATAAYETPLAQEVEVLRKFRDEYLLTNRWGRGIVSAYYRFSPPVAERIAKNKKWRALVRVGLKPVIWLCRQLTTCIPPNIK